MMNRAGWYRRHRRSGDKSTLTAGDDAHSELLATITDATGSTQMTWSRYGQLLAFTGLLGLPDPL